MDFHSHLFLLFLTIVSVLYFIIPEKLKWMYLLVASMVFYLSWIPKYGVVLIGSILVTYASSFLMEKMSHETGKTLKKLILALGILGNVGILLLFKYLTFALYIGNGLLGKLHMGPVTLPVTIFVAIGVSFFTLQMISYLIDTYKGICPFEKNPFRLALYASFFPIVVSGPFMRYADFNAQVRETHSFSYTRAKNGVLLIIWGLFEKMVLADRLYITVNHVYHNYYTFKGFSIALAMLFFTLELLCDFRAYIDIATGAAQILGYRLPTNFDRPLAATGILDFFKRFHVSFYTYVKEYIYLPVMKKTSSKVARFVVLLFMSVFVGLWQGGSMHFIAWGLCVYVFFFVGEITRPLRKQLYAIMHVKTDAASFLFGQRLSTFILISISLAFYRADGVKEGILMLKSLFGQFNPWIFFDGSLFAMGIGVKDFAIICVTLIIFIAVECLRGKVQIRAWFHEQNVLFRVLFTVGAIGIIYVFAARGAGYPQVPFIYFQF